MRLIGMHPALNSSVLLLLSRPAHDSYHDSYFPCKRALDVSPLNIVHDHALKVDFIMHGN